MPVKADWHETEAACPTALTGVDPFEQASSPSMEALSLDISADELHRRLVSLIRREGGLFDEGVVCAIKDTPDTSCSACPLHRGNDGSAMSALCGIGVDQEKVLTVLAAQRERQGATPL